MESIMNFLADNYIWFFVAAGILCFALIGFVIESRKKQKNEFKGESIEETKTEETPVASVETTNTPVEPLNSVNDTKTSTLENTMVISESPINSEPIVEPKPSGIEYYSGPIEMPINVPKVEPMPETIEEINTPVVEPIVESTVSYEKENNFNTNNIFDNNTTTIETKTEESTPISNLETTEEKKENNDYNIFDNMN